MVCTIVLSMMLDGRWSQSRRAADMTIEWVGWTGVRRRRYNETGDNKSYFVSL